LFVDLFAVMKKMGVRWSHGKDFNFCCSIHLLRCGTSSFSIWILWNLVAWTLWIVLHSCSNSVLALWARYEVVNVHMMTDFH